MKKIKAKYPNIFCLCGGFGPTFNPEYFISEGFDIAMIGEGEKTILDVCNYLCFHDKNIKNISGICYNDINNKILITAKRKAISNLNSLVIPSRDTMVRSIQRKSYIHISTSRGCNGHCLFCSVSAFFKKTSGPNWRGRSKKNIISEVSYLYKKGVRYIKAVDNSFIDGDRNINWCKQFAKQIKNKNLKITFRSALRADKVTNKILRYLKNAGFISFSVGIENGSLTALHRMNKSASLSSNIKALKLFKKNNIYMQAGFILFDADTTYKEFLQRLM